jgi:fructokinase
VAAAITPAAELLTDLWQQVREAGEVVLSFDPNVRPALVGAHDEAVQRVERFVRTSHLVKASDEDLDWLYPARPPGESAAAWADLGPELVVLTRGADGCVAFRPAAEPVDMAGTSVEVVDTIGAGDAFGGGFLAWWRREGLGAGDLARGEQVVEATRFACLVAARTCERPGAAPPRLAELDVPPARPG